MSTNDIPGNNAPVQRPNSLVPVIETCDRGHTYAYLSDHPRGSDGMKRCPHCMSIGLDRAREEIKELTSDETIWREGWAYAYSGAEKLYRDDGELQDSSTQPFIDWRRDTASTIKAKIQERARRILESLWEMQRE